MVMTSKKVSKGRLRSLLEGDVDKKQLNLIRKIRGEYLGEATEVENQLSNVIAIHFFPGYPFDKTHHDQYRLLESTILGHRSFTFSAKADALQYILKQSHPDLYEKYKGTLAKLRKVIEHRNVLAHGYFVQELPLPDLLKTQLNRPEQVMVETFSKGEVVSHFLTLKDARVKLKEAKDVSDSLGRLWAEIRKQAEEALPN